LLTTINFLDDSWLEITPEELDQMLKERYGTERNNFPQNSHPSQIPGQLNKFLEHMSGLDGVEFPGYYFDKIIKFLVLIVLFEFQERRFSCSP
jgi:SGT1 protein